MHCYTAPYIFDGNQFLSEGTAIVLDDKGAFLGFEQAKYLRENITCIKEGTLCPGFVNAHCHLELSHVRTKPHQGMVNFLRSIVAYEHPATSAIQQATANADETMWTHGIQVVGDICNTPHTLFCKRKSAIRYHSFIELFSRKATSDEDVLHHGVELLDAFRQDKCGGLPTLVPHSPYSVSVSLWRGLAKTWKTEETISIHYNESQEEVDFMKGQKNELATFIKQPLVERETSYNEWTSYVPDETRLLLVHNTLLSEEDMKYFSKEHRRGVDTFYCLCPRANSYITRLIPPLDLLEESKAKWCIGTDSLASNHSLCILEEIKALYRHFPTTPVSSFLRAATSVGAKALGLGKEYGCFHKDKNSGLLHLEGVLPHTIDMERSCVNRIV